MDLLHVNYCVWEEGADFDLRWMLHLEREGRYLIAFGQAASSHSAVLCNLMVIRNVPLRWDEHSPCLSKNMMPLQHAAWGAGWGRAPAREWKIHIGSKILNHRFHFVISHVFFFLLLHPSSPHLYWEREGDRVVPETRLVALPVCNGVTDDPAETTPTSLSSALSFFYHTYKCISLGWQPALTGWKIEPQLPV